MPRGDRRRAQEARQKAQEEEDRIASEMSRYLHDNLINSYFELEIAAYRDHPDWVPVMRKRYMRQHLHTLCRECKQYHNKTYARPLEEVLEDLRRAKAEYYEKQSEAEEAEADRLQAEYERNLESQT